MDFEKNNIEVIVQYDSNTENDTFKIPKVLDPGSYLSANVMTVNVFIKDGYIWFNDYNTGLSVDTYDKYYKVEVDISQGYQTVIEQLTEEIRTKLDEATGTAAESVREQVIAELEEYIHNLEIPLWEPYTEEPEEETNSND